MEMKEENPIDSYIIDTKKEDVWEHKGRKRLHPSTHTLKLFTYYLALRKDLK